jgi:hypothetical protein
VLPRYLTYVAVFVAAGVFCASDARASYAEFRFSPSLIVQTSETPTDLSPETTALVISAPTPDPTIGTPGSLAPAVVASLLREIPQTDPAEADTVHHSTRLANLLALEQLVVIFTDDKNYIHYRHRAGKINPLSGLPFARSVNEELMAAMTMNLTLRDTHHEKMLKWTMYAYPVLERAVLGSIFHYWKAFRM